MKAIRKSDGKVLEVSSLEYTDIETNVKSRYCAADGEMYPLSDLDFSVDEAKEAEGEVISGWVAIDEAYDACFLHTSKPHQESQEIADTGDYNTVWESDGKTYLLDRVFFPDLTWDSEPMEVEITIKPKKK